ncbi:MAG TPA: 6-hydroxymethylpterin diphosphokinase MptE-like protein [Chlamydiales bacterium]|nr:6-hydroxymethylpterin diphosphokinase MptE-like protein [Chlamydiales bacterium]
MINLFWPNGKLKRSVEFKEGIRSGSDRIWNEEGILLDEGFYENGNPIGTHKRWNKKGALIEEITYLDAKKRNYCLWDDEGNIRAEATWQGNAYRERAWDRFQNVWVSQGEFSPKIISQGVVPEGKNEDGFLILMERFPLLGLMYSSLKAIKTPFEFLKPFDIGKAEVVIVFGLRMGAPYFQLQDWLHEKPNRKLIFIEEQFADFIANSPHVSILKDPQVFLEHQFVAEKYPFHRVEILGLSSAKKLEAMRKITLVHALHQDRLHGYQPFHNFVQNVRQFPHSFYVNALKNKFMDVPAIVCGAGPSLQKAIPTLKKLADRAFIIAGGSTLAALSSQGVPIHFGVAIDPNLEEYRRLKNSFAFDTPLIYSTRVHPDVFQTCSGPFGYMRSGIGGVMEVWMEEELGLFDPLIGENLSHESISVTSICVALAQYLGCPTICLSGVDLAYTNKKRYADGVGADIDNSFQEIDAEKSSADRILRRKNSKGEFVHTAVRWIMEASALSHFARAHPEICWINSTDDGLPIQGIPNRELNTLNFPQTFDLKKRLNQEIAKAPMPSNGEKIKELQISLNRIVDHLEILAKEKPGSKALAELEIQDEMAYDLLFYDVNEILGIGAWKDFLILARKYQRVL